MATQKYSQRQVSRDKVNHQYKQMPKGYSLIKEIRSDPLYRQNPQDRDAKARKLIDRLGTPIGSGNIVAGNIYLMEYFYPKTEEQLPYYDAMPCSLIFGKFKTKKGEPRILAFSLHYLPPRIRFQVLDKVMDIYGNIYRSIWKSGAGKDLTAIGYQQLLLQLKQAKLEFAVHEYIPKLIGDSILVPPSLWHVAAFTEGRFKKQSRQAILNHWKNFKA